MNGPKRLYRIEQGAKLTGVCGGYTTFSTYMADTTSLWRNGRHVAACLYYVGTAVCGVLAVMFGALVGRNL